MTAGPIATGVVPANHATFGIVNGGVGGGGGGGASKVAREELVSDLESRPPTPPWLRPPSTYKPKGNAAERMHKAGKTTATAAADKAPTAAASAAAALVPTTANGSAPPSLTSQQPLPLPKPKASVPSPSSLVEAKSDTKKGMDSMRRSGSSLGQLAQVASDASIGEIPRTESALEQLARTASGDFLSYRPCSLFIRLGNLHLSFPHSPIYSCQICRRHSQRGQFNRGIFISRRQKALPN